MTLPTTLAEAEATMYARSLVRSVRDSKIFWCGVPLSFFEKADNQRAAMELMKQAAMDAPLAMIDLVRFARAGFDLAYDAAIELIMLYKHHAKAMPPSLAAFDLERDDPRHRPRKPRGKKKADCMMRDFAVTAIIADVCMTFGFKARRNTASKTDRLSGCHVVSLALQEEGLALGEHAVETIWKKYGERAFPGGLSSRPWPW